MTGRGGGLRVVILWVSAVCGQVLLIREEGEEW